MLGFEHHLQDKPFKAYKQYRLLSKVDASDGLHRAIPAEWKALLKSIFM
ncbi:MAG: hypothetical protein ABF445_09520 [Leuconostoc mesenteroides]